MYDQMNPIQKEQAAILSVVDEHDRQLAVLSELTESLYSKFSAVLSMDDPLSGSMDDRLATPSRGSSELYRRLQTQQERTEQTISALSNLRRIAEV